MILNPDRPAYRSHDIHNHQAVAYTPSCNFSMIDCFLVSRWMQHIDQAHTLFLSDFDFNQAL